MADSFCSHELQAKVAVLGAAGGIGQPLSMLMKMSPLIGYAHAEPMQCLSCQQPADAP